MSITDLPQGHWMHAALAKEKARLDAKKAATAKGPALMPGQMPPAMAGQGQVAAPVAGGLGVASKAPPMTNQQPAMPKMGM